MDENLGIIRRVDELGRIVIPKELRRALKLNHGDAVSITSDGAKMTITKYFPDDFSKTFEKIANSA